MKPAVWLLGLVMLWGCQSTGSKRVHIKDPGFCAEVRKGVVTDTSWLKTYRDGTCLVVSFPA